jgi:hypothetical protein
MWTAIVTMMSVIGAGCGGDDADNPASGGASGRAADSDADKGEKCGTTTCMPPEPAGDLTACCLDPFTSTCGTKKPGGQCATAQTTGDPRCPSVDIMMGGMAGLLLPSCCTDDGKCGINATMFGSMGCVELGTASEMAKNMGGANLMWPAPRACDP